MCRRIFLAILVLFIGIAAASAQTVIKTFKISSKDFSGVQGTPRIVRNGFDHQWLVAWRQGSTDKIIGRRIESDGKLRSKKTLASKVSGAPQSFDIFFDSVNYNYLLAYENASGLQVQLFNNLLKKVGGAQEIEAGVTGSIPRLSFDPVDEKFLLFWISDGGTSVKSILLNADGTPSGSVLTLKQASGSNTYRSLNISTNQDTGKLLALLTESDGTAAKLIGLRIKPDGSLQKNKALTVSPSDPDLNSVFADSSFSDAGTGFAFWSDNDTLKRRKVARSGRVAGGAVSITGESDDNSEQTSILFDSRNNQFVPVWTFGNRVRAMALTSSGSVQNNPFDVATSDFTNALNPTTSYDAQVGNAIVVWEDSTEDADAIAAGSAATFRIRGALFFFQSTSAGKNITIGDNFFSSTNGNGNLTISAGDTVTWTVNGNNPHTVTSGSESSAGLIFNSGNLNRGQTFTFRFTDAGAFPYFCQVHGSNTMSGIITVQTAGEPPPRY
ncbi:plastocyanin/azurin family copper-binding protein [bacterium]|nr:plastocyanin/azurin family copper-binding protein [bacterium]